MSLAVTLAGVVGESMRPLNLAMSVGAAVSASGVSQASFWGGHHQNNVANTAPVSVPVLSV